MGIFSKVVTARRTKSDLIALPQDNSEFRDALASSIREAACAVGTGRTFSVTSRGWSSPLDGMELQIEHTLHVTGALATSPRTWGIT